MSDSQRPTGANGPAESHFECPRCGTVRRSIDVRYDALGYPICPHCWHRPR